MKTIVNKTFKPLRIRLPGGKTLHLGPMKSGKISDPAADEESVRRLVQAGEVEILGGPAAHGAGAGESAGAMHEATHGHPPTTVILPKGNR